MAGPFGGYTANAEGQRFIECDYWSGQMMQEFYNELQSGKGPVFLKLDHLHEATIAEIESILHKVERPSRGPLPRASRHRLPPRSMIEMHISEIGFCSGHSASGVFVDEFARTTVPGLYAAGDMASVPHNYMLGAFTNGGSPARTPWPIAGEVDLAEFDPAEVAAEQARVLAPDPARGRHPAEPDRVQDPPPGQRLPPAAQGHPQDAALPGPAGRGSRGSRDQDGGPRRARADAGDGGKLDRRLCRDGGQRPRCSAPRAAGASTISASTIRSRTTGAGSATRSCARGPGGPVCSKRPVAPYLVPIEETERDAYDRQRIRALA